MLRIMMIQLIQTIAIMVTVYLESNYILNSDSKLSRVMVSILTVILAQFLDHGYHSNATSGMINNRGQWPDGWQTEGSGRSMWSKLPRSILGVLGVSGWQTTGLNALSSRGQWHECLVEAAAEHFTFLEM